jgi:CheY-like chemotaxis protein
MSCSILIVDDDEDTRAAFGAALRSQGYATVEARNGSEGMSLLRTGLRPDLILLDVDMPVLDGVGFRAAQLRDPALEHIPVVLVTAESDVATLIAVVRPEALLVKPVSYAPFLAAVSRAVKPVIQPATRTATRPEM